LLVDPSNVGSKSTISRFGERFRDDQYSLVSFLFVVLLLTVPPCPAICKSGVPSVPMESAPLGRGGDRSGLELLPVAPAYVNFKAAVGFF